MRTKIFYDEKEMNEFIKDKNVLDIKMTTTVNDRAWDIVHSFLVMYVEEESK